MEFGYKKQTNLKFDEAVEKARTELSKEGFGVITEINAKKTFKQKLDVDFENYIILGACHPATAHKVLTIEKDMGLMLPCNVIVYQEGELVYVSAVLPTVAMNMLENTKLAEIAKEVEEKLKKVVDAV
jgi:uncharacterized protein (DUF302 family)